MSISVDIYWCICYRHENDVPKLANLAPSILRGTFWWLLDHSSSATVRSKSPLDHHCGDLKLNTGHISCILLWTYMASIILIMLVTFDLLSRTNITTAGENCWFTGHCHCLLCWIGQTASNKDSKRITNQHQLTGCLTVSRAWCKLYELSVGCAMFYLFKLFSCEQCYLECHSVCEEVCFVFCFVQCAVEEKGGSNFLIIWI